MVVTGQQADQRRTIENALLNQLKEAALRHGVDAKGAVVVIRVDTGEGIRNASEGIKLVYALIGWGILVLGGLGLLVSELITVRNRTWFFGLARAVGASTRDIAALIVADIVLVLLLGTTVAVLVSLAIQPVANSFARQAFQIDIRLLQPSVIPRLLLGGLLVLAVAGIYPAVIATRQDPLDVLESKIP
jgi:putative ABC transport system permease protein